MKAPLLVASIVTLMLGGCETTSFIINRGQVAGSGETFTGRVHGLFDGDRFEIVFAKGVTCVGRSPDATSLSGHGTFRCDDGRKGSFTFAAPRCLGGTGHGIIGGKTFTFSISCQPMAWF
jgi:hypothetical protein